MSTTANTSIMLASDRTTPNVFNDFVRTRSVLDGDGGPMMDLCVYDMQPFGIALANVVGHFRSTEAAFLLYVDSDLRWHPSTVKRAVELSVEADVLCVDRATVEADLRANGDRPESATTLLTVESASLGFALIRRSTVDTLCERNPCLAFDGYGSKHMAWDLFGLVQRDDRLYGEQASFCLRCRDAGLTIRLLSEAKTASP